MNADSKDSMRQIFVEALQVPQGEKQQWLRDRCGSDELLLRKVMRMLSLDESSRQTREDPLEEGAARFVSVDESGRMVAETVDGPVPDSNDGMETFCELTRVGHYEIVRELGRGGMGIVYLARKVPTGTAVALKLFTVRNASLDTQQKMFAREASILSSLNHKRLVKCIEFGIHQRQMYIAMEYIRTVDVHTVLRAQSRAAQIRLSCGISCYVLEALEHAHQAGVVHRDVKPANVLAYLDQGRLKAKVADFGLAKNFQDAGFTTISQDHEIKGTLPFIAPEQLKNARYADPRSDIYSVAACLYFFLTKKTPYAAYQLKDSLDLVNAILKRDPVALADVDSGIPEAVASVVNRALRRDPEHRFSSAEEMRQALLPLVSRKS